MSSLLYEKNVSSQYAIFSLNRPDRLNALNSRMMIEIDEALKDFDHDKNMRVGIITGKGRAFSAGADIREGVERDAAIDKLTQEGELNEKQISRRPDK